MADDFAESLRRAGVVGAGGAGFPAHIKAASKAEVVIANGAECEPLLQKDQEILEHFAGEVVLGMTRLMRSTGAERGVLAIKEKHAELIRKAESAVKGKAGLSVRKLGDFYPAGDEFSLVYDVTGRLIPPGGIPIQVGVVVNNVETLYNAARAGDSPVTETFLTVTGAVKKPCTLSLPVGTAVSEALALAGGVTIEDYAVLDGGAMMGRVLFDFAGPLTKTSAGLIVLPRAHPLIRRKSAPRSTDERVGKSACDQCSLCTEFCPRYLLGYAIQPHKVMRSLLFSGPGRKTWNEWALLCCECQLCTLYACPEDLAPGRICVAAKADLAGEKVTWKNSSLNMGRPVRAHPGRSFRKVPVRQLVARLGLADYEAEAPLARPHYVPESVRIPLKQHAGAPAVAVVKTGEKVSRGDLIGEIPEGQLGARVHASISGTVAAVADFVEIRRGKS